MDDVKLPSSPLPPPIATSAVAGIGMSSTGSMTATESSVSASASAVTPLSDIQMPTMPPGHVPPPIKRRAPIACRRCRRMRSKCLHEKGKAPCKACDEAGLTAADCIFPIRGQPDNDREYRHPRMRAEKHQVNTSNLNKRDPNKVRREILDAPILPPSRGSGSLSGPSAGPGPNRAKTIDEWDLLPPLIEIIEAVNKFTRHYFQLGFIPKQMFPERLRTDHRSVSPFLLLSILSISSRFTPSLIMRHGSGLRAVDFFMERASNMALTELYREPTLERCQGFYLLSIAQQGSGWKNRSYINMGIAMRMAALMQLHREETYTLPNPTPELIVRAESARRTLWMLHSQDNLHSGPLSPVSLAASDITALLPGNEEDFSKGREPKSRAALEDTPPAIENPSLISDPGRSLFASLIQTHHFWGCIARRAVSSAAATARPWEPSSEYARMAYKLQMWEKGLPHEHLWSSFLLKGYKTEGQDLAYLGVTMVTRLCNIVIRRAYLKQIIKPDHQDPKLSQFWSNMALELFTNVRHLYLQIDSQFTARTPEESVGAQMAAFCVYSCGLFATYLCKYPNICPDPSIAREAPMMLHRTMGILMECKEVWPLASRWVDALEKFSRDPKASGVGPEGSMADGRDPIPRALHPALSPGPPNHHRPQPPPPPPTPMEDSKRGLLPSPILPPPIPTPQLARHPSPHQNQVSHMTLPPGYDPQQPNQSLPRPGSGQQDGLGMLISAFDSNSGPGNHMTPLPPPTPHAVAPPTFGSEAYYGPSGPVGQIAPGNDGFEGELQFYIDGSTNWVNGAGGGLYGY